MFQWVSVAEYTSRMDTEPLGALGMDLVHTYDAVNIRGIFTPLISHVRFGFSQATASELDVETWAMGLAHGDLSKNTSLLGCIYHLPPKRTMRIS